MFEMYEANLSLRVYASGSVQVVVLQKDSTQ